MVMVETFTVSKRLTRSIRFLRLEMIVTGTHAAGAMLLPFYIERGLGQFELGLTQAIFTLELMLLTIPAGWLADKTSRRVFNLVGDLASMGGFLWYAASQDLLGIIIAETFLAIGAAMSTGADNALSQSYYSRFPDANERLDQFSTRVSQGRPVAQICMLTIAGVGVLIFHGTWVAFVVAALPFAVGATLSYFMMENGDADDEAGEREQKHKAHLRMLNVARGGLVAVTHPHQLIKSASEAMRHSVHSWHEMWKDVTHIRKDHRLVWVIIARTVSFRMTTPLNVAITAIMFAAGVPLAVAAFAWIAKPVAALLGATIADAVQRQRKRKKQQPLGPFARFFWPASAVISVLIVMGVDLNYFTVALYVVIGCAEGWFNSLMPPMIQVSTPKEVQATVGSVDDALTQVLYFPLVLGFSWLADINVEWMLLTAAGLFVLMTVPTAIKLHPLILPTQPVVWEER